MRQPRVWLPRHTWSNLARGWLLASWLLTSCNVDPFSAGSGPGGGSLLGISGDITGGAGATLISVSPRLLVYGTYLSARTLELRNLAGRVVSYEVESDAPWVHPEPASGQVGTRAESVSIHIDRPSLPAGEHQAWVTVLADGQSAARVDVRVTVSPPEEPTGDGPGTPSPVPGGTPPAGPDGGGGPQLYVAPGVLGFGSTVTRAVVYVRNVGGEILSYRAATDTGWVSLEGAEGISSGEYKPVVVHVDRTGLPPGDYEGALLVTGAGQEVPVHLRMTVRDVGNPTRDPVLQVSTAALDFGLETVEAPFVVRNVGGGTLNYRVSSDVAWASPTPVAGALGNEEALIRVSVSRVGLAPGEHTGLLGVHADGNQWHGVVVRVTVPARAPLLWVSTEQLDFGTEAAQLSFQLRRSSPGSLPFTITSTANWMEVAPTRGVATSDELTVRVTATRCAPCDPGVLAAELQIDAEGEKRRTVHVRIEVPPLPSAEEMVGWFRALPPLPKVHYGWPPWDLLNDPASPLLYEWVRITHSVGLSAFWHTPTWTDTAVAVCHAVNAGHPTIPATVVLYYSPYHFGGWPEGAPPTYNGPEYQVELDTCRRNLTQVKALLDAANTNRGANVRVSALLLDSEVWMVKEAGEPGRETWNAALNEKYDAFYAICKSIFPDVPVHWYVRGYPPGWRRFTLEERGDAASSENYVAHDLPWLRAIFRAVHREARAHNIDLVVPSFALAAGYQKLPDGQIRYVCDVPYDLGLSWQLGAEVNDPWYAQFPEQYAPWDAAQIVFLYPKFPEATNPRFAQHFVAYVKGAHNLPLRSP